MMEQKSVVVTGATSFLGRYIIQELCAKGCIVYAIIRPESKWKDQFKSCKNVITVLANMGDIEKWRPDIPRADWFIHLGWDGPGAAGRTLRIL